MKVKMYFLKRKPASTSEIEKIETVQRWMLENLYDLAWEAEFKNLVTPDIIAMRFRVEPEPFGIPLKKRLEHSDMSTGDIIQIGPAYYLVLRAGFRELQL